VPSIRHPLFDPKHPGRRRVAPFPPSPLDENEQVVLVDDQGTPIGLADKATVHGAHTPRHLAFSCYGFRADGRLLVTRRAADKATFPSVWTNTACGHPAPGEEPADAAARRMRYELRIDPVELRMVLPDFSYRASDGAVEENELCPVLVARIDDDPHPRPDEVGEWAWWTWAEFLAAAADPDSGLSPWARLQAPLLDAALFRPEKG
jgi:isopentenyl-diphosphate delta-isomerase